MGLADLHIHTTASDGAATVQALLDHVAQQCPNLDLIAITDHDTLDASWWALERAANYPFDIVPGVEVSSCDGHVLALWVTEPIPPSLNLAETVAAIHEAGGLAILAHPFHCFIREHLIAAWRHWRTPEVLLQAKIDAIETHNAGVAGWGCNAIARRTISKLGLAATGGSDAHTLGAVGSGLTHYPGSSAADLRAALLAGQTRAEGTAWPKKDYIAYFRHERQRKGMRSSARQNSSPRITR